jgi:hypothetical protein
LIYKLDKKKRQGIAETKKIKNDYKILCQAALCELDCYLLKIFILELEVMEKPILVAEEVAEILRVDVVLSLTILAHHWHTKRKRASGLMLFHFCKLLSLLVNFGATHRT